MEKDILSRVIEIEKEIQEKLRKEKVASLELIEKARKEAEEAAAREGEVLKEQCRRAVDEAAAAAEERAAEVRRDCAVRTDRLSAVSLETLERLLMKHLPGILPEGGSSGEADKGRGPS